MKILDLFNEYNLSPEMTGGEMEQPRTEKDWNTMSRIYKAYIISKDFGWIKWLVENDKIDGEKVAEHTYVKVNGVLYELIAGYHYNLRETVLMLLAISDTPIQDLCVWLK